MTTLKTMTIAAVLVVGGASLATAQNGPPTGGELPVAGGAGGGYPGYGGTAMDTRRLRYMTTPPQLTATQLQLPTWRSLATATQLQVMQHRPRQERPLLS
jgi:hypothetical protein